jgi:NitT/TauT family transport system substrate-binding protein
VKHHRFAGRLRGLFLALTAFCVLPPATVTAAQTQKLIAAWSSVSAINSPFWVMNDAGFFKQEGLDVDLIFVLSSPTVAKATLAGEVAFSGANSQVVVDSGLQGGDLIAIGSMANVVAFYVMASPEIKSVADLKGKTVGISRFGGSSDFGMRMLLAKYGLEPARDVAFVQIGGMPEIAAALSKRIISAAMMSHPMAYVAEQGGAKVLANLAKEEIPFMHMGFTTTRKFVKERRGQVKAMIRAYGRAVHFMHTRKEQTRAIYERYTKIKDLGMLDGSIKYGLDFIEKVPFVTTAAFQVTLDEVARSNPKAKQAKPQQFFDNSLVQEVVDEGLFTKLWGRNP